jgi:hypothetical protein
MRKGLLAIVATLFFIGVKGQMTSIPGANFEQALIDLGFDSGVVDGSVPTANIDTVSLLQIWGYNISDLTGIEDFSNLTSLSCMSNQLTSIDVSQNAALITLSCGDNQLTSLDVSQNIALQNLACEANELTNLDVTQNVELLQLICYNNQLTSLDVSYNNELEYLICQGNQLASLDVSQSIDLAFLDCSSNQIISLDVSQNIVLSKLWCGYGELSCLSVKNGNNSNFINFNAAGSPNLNCIEVDDVAWSTVSWTGVDGGASFSANCNSACSSTVVGINESDIISVFSLYPNPASNNINIDFENEEETVNLQVVNIHGQTIFSKEYHNTDNIRVDIEGFSSGIYIANIITPNGQKAVKFIKE